MVDSGWIATCTTIPGINKEINQDAVAIEKMVDGVALIVADGAGSARLAHLGAKKAVDLTRVEVRQMANPVDWKSSQLIVEELNSVMEHVHDQFVDWTEDEGLPLLDCHTTLAFVICAKEWVACASVGDSFVVTIESDNIPRFLQLPLRPGVDDSAADMLIDWHEAVEYQVLASTDVRAVLLSTDGLEKLITYRIVENGAFSRAVPWSVHPALQRMLIGFADTGDRRSLEILNNRALRETKGDDIGVALATWR